MIKTHIEIHDYRAITMHLDQLQDYVERALERKISEEVRKHMTIAKTRSTYDDTTIYTGTYNVTSSTLPAGIVHSSSLMSVQKNLRVIEYTKNDKVTRVELQAFDAVEGKWCKIPRIKIEE
jgi:hypothetical protein